MPELPSATSSSPEGSVAQTLLGIGQTLFSGKRKAEKRLEEYANSYQPSSSILDYYNKSLQKYSANPYTSQGYQNRSNIIQRNLATGISGLQDRRSALSGIGRLVQVANDANANAASQAEAQQNANLAQLGRATGMRSAADEKKYDLKYNLLSAKAGAANATKAAGISNIFGGINGMSEARAAAARMLL